MARISRSSLLAASALLAAGLSPGPRPIEAAEARVATFYIVRHAERADGPDGVDGGPPLTLTGMRRAEELRDTLRGAPIAAVYSTRTLRTWQTATPTATLAGVPIAAYNNLAPAFFAGLKAKHAGQAALIVGHSDTVDDLVSGLGGDPGAPIGDSFDNLFVVTVDGPSVKTERRKYRVIETIGRLEFAGVERSGDLSAIAAGPSPDDLVVGDDEGTAIQVLKKKVGDGYEVRSTIGLGGGGGDGKEFDIEGIARHGAGPAYYVVGSHAPRRKNIFRPDDEGSTLAKIRKRFEEDSPEREKDREVLFRVEIDPATGELAGGPPQKSTLRGMIDGNRVLAPFGKLAATENGVDIEGIASDGERLYVGLRGPVLRFGFAAVVAFKPEAPENADLRYLRMDGRGVRDLARVGGGFLVIAGPTGDSSQSCRLYHWDGESELPGVRGAGDPPAGKTTLLGTIPAAPGAPGAEPEGILVLKDEPNAPYEVLFVYDGVEGGSPTICRAMKP
jgi:phosphohistidine phosphatase SixA